MSPNRPTAKKKEDIKDLEMMRDTVTNKLQTMMVKDFCTDLSVDEIKYLNDSIVEYGFEVE